jgi:hypothetical protein
MHSSPDIIGIARVIQQAVAPVFLLTGVGAILGVLTNRLSRIIDRVRTLTAYFDELAVHPPKPEHAQTHAESDFTRHRRREMAMLGRRRKWIYRAISLCTICALLVCLVIATLFLAAEFGADPSRLVGALFVTAMLSLIGGLLCFLREITLATEQFDLR